MYGINIEGISNNIVSKLQPELNNFIDVQKSIQKLNPPFFESITNIVPTSSNATLGNIHFIIQIQTTALN